MPSKSPEQARLMHAIASGWTPSRMKSPPSRAVAREFVEADKKYSGGFAENRYAKGGLAFMNEVDSNSERARPLRGFQRGGRRGGRRRNGGAGASTTTYSPPPAPAAPPPPPWGIEAGTTQEMLGRMGYSGPMGYIGVVSGLRQAGWTPAPGADPSDLRNTMWYPPEQTLTGGDGGGGPPPRIIPTDPASYVGGTASGTSGGGGGGGGGGSGEGSEYRKDLRQHQRRIEDILGSARGGHVNYYQEGGAARPGHAEGPNPFEGKGKPAQYRLWESENHIDPPPPPPPAAEPEKVPWYMKLVGYGSEESAGKIDEELAEMGQAYGGRVGYQLGGLAIAAPAGGVPPWISPTGSGPDYMDEPPPGYQFGGIADRFNPPVAAPAAGPVPPSLAGRAAPDMSGPAPVMQRQMEQAQSAFNPQTGGPRGGVMGGPASRAPQGGLAAMIRQAQQQRGALHPGAQGPGGGFLSRFAQQSPGQPLHPGAQGPGGGGFLARIRAAQQQQQAQAGGPGGGGQIVGDFGGTRGPDVISDYWGPPGGPGDPMRPRGPMAPGGDPLQLPIMDRPNPNIGRPGYDPIGDMGPITGPGRRPWKQRNRIAPPPGKFPQGDERGPMIPGGPRVPPNMRGYMQKQRMMNRPPANVGGGANRVGMADQQGALSRAMQRGTGRPPMSRRSGFGRAR